MTTMTPTQRAAIRAAFTAMEQRERQETITLAVFAAWASAAPGDRAHVDRACQLVRTRWPDLTEVEALELVGKVAMRLALTSGRFSATL